MKKIHQILEKQLEKISISKGEFLEIERELKGVLEILNKNIKKQGISAEVFVGGSFVKGTMIKKDRHDADVFVRFVSKYKEEELSKLLAKAVPKTALKLHGSRDYFVVKLPKLDVEIIPIARISKPEEARNSTDLSYFHVRYILGKINKDKKLADEIKIAKAFIHYAGCYGAESYIHGFSGYAVELLLAYYRDFMKFVKAMAGLDLKKKLVIDGEKLYKNKEEIMRMMNESKLNSPIILIDPTFKQRNALAALSVETLEKLQKACKAFLKNPSEKFFISENKMEKFSKKYGKNLQTIIIMTNRQAGDIAGTKLKKFYEFFAEEMKKYFDIASEFDYDESKNEGIICISAKQKKQLEFKGPLISMKEALKNFKKQHRKVTIKKGKAYAYEKSLSFNEFLRRFENERSRTIDEMGISEIKRV